MNVSDTMIRAACHFRNEAVDSTHTSAQDHVSFRAGQRGSGAPEA